MDRNSLTGIMLILAIVVTWLLFFNRQEPKPQDPGAAGKKDTLSTQVDPTPVLPPGMTDSAFIALPDSERKAILNQNAVAKYGDFAPLYEGTDRAIHIHTDKLDFSLHAKGSQIKPLVLNEYKEYAKDKNGKPLPLVADSLKYQLSAVFSYPKNYTGFLDTKDLFFTPNTDKTELQVAGGDSLSLVMTAAIAEGKAIEWKYTIYGDRYDIGMELNIKGLGTAFSRDGKFDLVWKQQLPQTEKAIALSRQKATLQYYLKAGGLDNLNPAKADSQSLDVAEAVEWVSFRNQFFAQTILMPKDMSFGFSRFTQTTPKVEGPTGPIVREMAAELEVDLGGKESESHKFQLLNTPLDYDKLLAHGRGLEGQVYLGWGPLTWINKYMVLPVFRLLEGTVGHYGFIILILAILIKVLLLPFQIRTHVSMSKMRLVNTLPEIKKIDEKHKDNPTKASQEKMAHFRKYGVSMLGGCLPMLFSYPFLIALFMLFPNLIEMRQVSFLWAEDLSTYDSVLDLGFHLPMYGDHVSLFTLLMTVSIFAFTIVNQRMQSTPQNNPVLKYMPYVMPLLFLGFLNSYAAGLSWYYLCSNLLAIAQTQILKIVIPDSKLMAQLEATAKGNEGKAPKGRMDRWIEAQQKKQAEMSKERSKNKPGKPGK